MTKPTLSPETQKTWENPKLIDAGATIADYMGRNELTKLQLPIGYVAISVRELAKVEQRARDEGYREGVKMMEWRIDCSTLISELYGWKSIVLQAVDDCLEKWIDAKDQRKHLTKSLTPPTTNERKE